MVRRLVLLVLLPIGCSAPADRVEAETSLRGALDFNGSSTAAIDPDLEPFEIEATIAAFEDWGRYCSSIPTRYRVGETSAPDAFRVRLRAEPHPANPTAQARNDGASRLIDVYRGPLDDAYAKRSEAPRDLMQTIIAHELGHWLGAGHVDEAPAVMMTDQISSYKVTEIDRAAINPDRCTP